MFRLALHAGAGDPASGAFDHQSRQELARIARLGLAGLAAGKEAINVVEAVVAQLEDCPLFNAGVGSVLNAEGSVEMDAAIMDGATHRCGAVAGVSLARSPVRLARAVMERTGHVFFAGPAADRLNQELGLETVASPEFFSTPRRRRQLAALIRGRDAPRLDHDAHFGTVGCVAKDQFGRLAAATSTGGLTGKRPGRVGDSALIGAGTWAHDAGVAISCTGTGESFIRCAFSAQVDARVRWAGQSLEKACLAALAEVTTLGGHGGCIAIDREGKLAMPFTTRAMYRAWVDESGEVRVAVGALA